MKSFSLVLMALCFSSLVSTVSTASYFEYEILQVTPLATVKIAGEKKLSSGKDALRGPTLSKDRPSTNVRVKLSEGFFIDANLYQESSITGFGIRFRKFDTDFSWEWFDKTDPGRFQKRQGDQMIEVEIFGKPFFEEVARIKFLEDTRLRTKELGRDVERNILVIKAGSELFFRD